MSFTRRQTKEYQCEITRDGLIKSYCENTSMQHINRLLEINFKSLWHFVAYYIYVLTNKQHNAYLWGPDTVVRVTRVTFEYYV